jgi:hypothetical protein
MIDLGNSDFSSIFASVAEERREEQERRELERVLRLLDERVPSLAQQQQQQQQQPWPPQQWYGPYWPSPYWPSPHPSQQQPHHVPLHAPSLPPRIENLRVLASGEIDRSDDEPTNQHEGARVKTLDDLPRENLFEMFMPPSEPEEPMPIVVHSGRRLRDGKLWHTLGTPGLDLFSWSGLAPETVLAVLSLLAVIALLVAFVLLGRLRAAIFGSAEARIAEAEAIEKRAVDARAVERAIERAVERALERRFAQTV